MVSFNIAFYFPLVLPVLAQTTDRCSIYSSQVSSLRSNSDVSSYCTRYISGTGSYTRTVTSTTTTNVPTSTAFQTFTSIATVATSTAYSTTTLTSTTTVIDCAKLPQTSSGSTSRAALTTTSAIMRRQRGGGRGGGGFGGGGGGGNGWGDDDDDDNWGNGGDRGNNNGRQGDSQATFCNCLLEKTSTTTSTTTVRTGVASSTKTVYSSTTRTITSLSTATATTCVPHVFDVYIDQYQNGTALYDIPRGNNYRPGLIIPDTQNKLNFQLRNGSLVDTTFGSYVVAVPYRAPYNTPAANLLLPSPQTGPPEGSLNVTCTVDGALSPANSTSNFQGILNCQISNWGVWQTFICNQPGEGGDSVVLASYLPNSPWCYSYFARPRRV